MIFRAQHLGQNNIEHVIQCDFLLQPDYRATTLDIFKQSYEGFWQEHVDLYRVTKRRSSEKKRELNPRWGI